MANTFASAFESAKKTATPVESFTGDVRAMGATFLEENEVFRIPTDFTVFKNEELSKNAKKDVCFTLAEILEGDEVKTGKNVYPGIFNRTVYKFHKDENGNIINLHETAIPKGKPVDDFNSKTTIQEAMKEISGKKIRIKDIQYVETRNFDRTDTTTMPVYEFEYVD